MTTSTWRIEPKGFLSRHFDLYRNDELVTTLRMGFWRERCRFSIAGHHFSIHHKSLWPDAFQLRTDDQGVCDATRKFWSHSFALTATPQQWLLLPARWFSRTFRLVTPCAGKEIDAGTIRSVGWFTRRRYGEFSDLYVPPPIQVLAIFLVLVVANRQSKSN